MTTLVDIQNLTVSFGKTTAVRDVSFKIKQGEIHIAELQKMSMSQLIEEARREKVTEVTGLKKQDLIFRILKERVKMKTSWLESSNVS